MSNREQRRVDTDGGSADTGVEQLPVDACLALLRGADIGRLIACSDTGSLEVFPINFIVDRGTIVFRSDEGAKTQMIRKGATTALEADGHDDASGIAWSVVAWGPCHVVERFDEMLDTLEMPPISPWLPNGKHLIVRLDPERVSGRRFRRAAAPPGE